MIILNTVISFNFMKRDIDKINLEIVTCNLRLQVTITKLIFLQKSTYFILKKLLLLLSLFAVVFFGYIINTVLIAIKI